MSETESVILKCTMCGHQPRSQSRLQLKGHLRAAHMAQNISITEAEALEAEYSTNYSKYYEAV